jgi:hypothetical protein
MPTDHVVYEPDNEHIAQVIVRYLEGKGYTAGYQLGYPHNKIFINTDSKEKADRISKIFEELMEKLSLNNQVLTDDELIGELGDLIPETSNVKQERLAENEYKENVKKDNVNSKISENEIYNNAKLEEWKSKIAERLNFLNNTMMENPDDPSNEMVEIAIDTLVWVLENIPGAHKKP